MGKKRKKRKKTEEPMLKKCPLRLIVNNPDDADATLEFAWCLSKEAIDYLEKKRVKNPHLLVVVAQVIGSRKDPTYEEVERRAVPLDRGMEFIEFSRPGRYIIKAMIVWSTDDDHQQQEAREQISRGVSNKDTQFVEKYAGPCLEREVTSGHLRYYVDYLTMENEICTDEIPVNVSKNLFAEKPSRWYSKWLWWWTNLWFEKGPRNECLWRRRFFIAFSIQPPLVGLWILIKAIICLFYGGWLLFTGRRWVSFKPIIHPFTYRIVDVDDADSHDCPTWHNKAYYTRTKKDGTNHSALWKTLTTPWHWSVVAVSTMFSFSFVALTGTLITTFPLSRTILLILLVSILAFEIIATILVLLIWIISLGIRKTLLTPEKIAARNTKRGQKRQEKDRRRNEEDERIFDEYYEKRLRPITCDGPTEASVEALPPSHQTVYLRFKAFKKRVCRPFAT